MSAAAELLVSAAIVIGGVFILVGAYGLLKLDKPMSRLHAPTKASTLGVGSVLLASVIYAFARGEFSLHELLILAFLFVTAPISANFVAKVVIHRRRITEELPSAGEDSVWATTDKPRQDTRS
jgi:multicomponent K+:H+ antiporter subunit G